MIEREDQWHVGAVATDAELDDFTVPFDVGEPHRPPPRLPGDAQYLAPDVGVEPGGDAANVVVRIGHVFLRGSGPTVVERLVWGSSRSG